MFQLLYIKHCSLYRRIVESLWSLTPPLLILSKHLPPNGNLGFKQIYFFLPLEWQESSNEQQQLRLLFNFMYGWIFHGKKKCIANDNIKLLFY